MSKYDYNKDYFQTIDTSEKAYWLGFLYADGCIVRFYKNEILKSMSLEITLSCRDKGHLEKLNRALESNVPIRNKKVSLSEKEYGASRLTINCTKLCYDLIDKGCIPQKSCIIRMPTDDIVSKELKKDFLRGYFDGNGCIHIGLMNDKPHIEISISTGTEAMLKDIASFLFTEKAVTVIPKINKDKHSRGTDMFYYGDSVKDFLDYIYSDCVVYLDRKYNQYKDFYRDYKLNRHGVYWHPGNKAYVVTIRMNDKHIRIGQSKDLETAIQMRKEAEIEKTRNCLLSQ